MLYFVLLFVLTFIFFLTFEIHVLLFFLFNLKRQIRLEKIILKINYSKLVLRSFPTNRNFKIRILKLR